MKHLKNKNSKKCASILRQVIAEAALTGEKKQVAVLALEQLQGIAAGKDTLLEFCIGRPLVEVSSYKN